MINSERMYENLKKLVAVPSVSGTTDEKWGAYKIQELLYEIPYFAEHRDNVKLIPFENDVLDRQIVTAYLECCPESNRVIILTGHYDVVDVEEFGNLKDIAYDIEAISQRINELAMDEDCLKDFESNEWIFGRGVADMKFGHALCLELLRHYSEEKNIKGNILYVGVGGEETNSEGMLSAVPFFNEFSKEKNIEYEALLLTECYMVENQVSDQSHYIHYGSSGKIMPMFFCAGAATHAEEPLQGLDPLLMSNEVYRRLHLSTDFCEQVNGTTGSLPVCLKFYDLKTTYSCSTPLYAASYYSIATLSLDPKDLMNKLISVANHAAKAASDFVDEKAKAYDILKDETSEVYRKKIEVATFHEVYEEAAKDFGDGFEKMICELIKAETRPGVELQDIAIQIVKKTYETLKNKRPMIIVSIIPPYYPDVYMNKNGAKASLLIDCVDDLISYAKEIHGENLKFIDYYCVSDLCYTALDEGKNFDYLFENVVGANQMYMLPTESMKEFSVPGVVLGGYGKDLHKHTERLHKKYNFEVLPDLYMHLIESILKRV